jgi:DtxR family Mn-dependent transcriptional regulator
MKARSTGSGAARTSVLGTSPVRTNAGSANPATATEDYLKSIYQHTEWQPEPITPSALAAKLGVAPPSVTEMVKKLAAAGLVVHVPYGPLRLTADGMRAAVNVVRRHRLIETWLVQEMGYGWHEVHDEAEVLEHSISGRLLDAIDERLGFPEQDPHGDPVPRADGTVRSYRARLLAEAPAGDSGVVIRISDRDPELLRQLARDGIRPGTKLTVTATDADTIEVTRDRSSSVCGVPASGAAAIWITA